MKTRLLHIDHEAAMKIRFQAALSRHSSHAEMHERLAEPTAEDTLIAAASEFGASCIVMGGYGHARMRELVFGGVTPAMLQACPVPLLLSH